MLSRLFTRGKAVRHDVSLDGGTALRPAAHVLATCGEGRTVLLDTRASRYWGLDEVAGEIWKQVEAGRRVPEIVDALESRFDAPRTELERDTTDFLGKLLAERLVVTS
jgi:hypothetical protein